MKLELNLHADSVLALTEQFTKQIEINYSDLADEVSLELLGEHVRVSASDVAEQFDLNELAREIDLNDLANQFDLSEIASEISAYDVAKELDVSEVAAEIDMNELANDVAERVDLNVVSQHLDNDKLGTLLVERMVDFLTPEKVHELIMRGSLFDNMRMNERLKQIEARQAAHEQKIQNALNDFHRSMNTLLLALKGE